MPTLSQAQMTMYALAAGLPQPSVWAAIGQAESSGRTDVVNSIGCVGIWQINQPVWVRTHPTWTVAWLKDPAHNAAAARVVYDAQGFGAWQSYTTGAYRQYLTGAAAPAGATDANWWDDFQQGFENGWNLDPGGEAKDLGGDVPGVQQGEDVLGGLEKAGVWLSKGSNWLRIGYVIGGGALVIVALAMVLKDQELKAASALVGGAPVKAARAVAGKAKSVRSARREKSSGKEDQEEEGTDE